MTDVEVKQTIIEVEIKQTVVPVIVQNLSEDQQGLSWSDGAYFDDESGWTE